MLGIWFLEGEGERARVRWMGQQRLEYRWNGVLASKGWWREVDVEVRAGDVARERDNGEDVDVDAACEEGGGEERRC